MTTDQKRVKHLAENLRRLMAERGLSQRDVAAASGVPQATLSRILAHKNEPLLNIVCRLAEYFGKAIEELTAPAPKPNGKVNRCPKPHARTLTNEQGNGYNPSMTTTAEQIELPAIIGRRIAEKRHERGISQDDLAAQVGLSRVSVNRIEKGRQMPAVTTLRSIAAILNLTTNELLAGI